MIGYGSLLVVDIDEVCGEPNYITDADGKGDEPHCVAILIIDPEVAHNNGGNTGRQLSVSSIRGVLPDSIDKPLAPEYPDCDECTESSRYESCEPDYILDMNARYELRLISFAVQASVFFYICSCEYQIYFGTCFCFLQYIYLFCRFPMRNI